MGKLALIKEIQREIAEVDEILETGECLSREHGRHPGNDLMMFSLRQRREQLVAEMKELQGEDE